MKTLTLTLATLILGVSFNACASFRDAKKYEMKKSPCVCFEEVRQIG